jgi:hypothetical protein
LKTGWEIANKPGLDDKVKLQTLALISECEKNIMDLVTNGVYVTNAYNSVQAKLNQLDTSDRQPNANQNEEEKETTTNGVF